MCLSEPKWYVKVGARVLVNLIINSEEGHHAYTSHALRLVFCVVSAERLRRFSGRSRKVAISSRELCGCHLLLLRVNSIWFNHRSSLSSCLFFVFRPAKKKKNWTRVFLGMFTNGNAIKELKIASVIKKKVVVFKILLTFSL